MCLASETAQYSVPVSLEMINMVVRNNLTWLKAATAIVFRMLATKYCSGLIGRLIATGFQMAFLDQPSVWPAPPVSLRRLPTPTDSPRYALDAAKFLGGSNSFGTVRANRKVPPPGSQVTTARP